MTESVRHFVTLTLFKCAQTEMASRNPVEVRNSMADTSHPPDRTRRAAHVRSDASCHVARALGSAAAVLAAVTPVFIVLGLAGWTVARQMDHLADDLPTHRPNILTKIRDNRGAGKEGSVEKPRAVHQHPHKTLYLRPAGHNDHRSIDLFD